ncbi:MAG: hypothetical protein L3J15_00855 [Devosiaceae bacterium]|nr:hypothetical protein [Devosiaceae bacterium]
MTNIPNLIEVALLLLIAFLIGCFIGYFLRRIFQKPSAETVPEPAPAPVVAASVKKVTAKPDNAAPDGKPLALDGPRDGKKDDLKRIKGVGPKIETTLNKLGIYHFDQISVWSRKTIKWIDNYLSFKGRIDREKWVKQAGQLAKGDETEFSKRADKGAVPSSRSSKKKK